MYTNGNGNNFQSKSIDVYKTNIAIAIYLESEQVTFIRIFPCDNRGHYWFSKPVRYKC